MVEHPGDGTERVHVDRTAARVLPVNDDGRVLLLQGFEPAHPEVVFWFTVGGGIEPGEDDRQAAVRELAEETGVVAAVEALSGPLLTETVEFSWGRYDVTQTQTWWAVAVGDPEVSFAGLDQVERDTTLAHRWWDPDELAASDQSYLPNLVELMRTAITRVG